MLGRIYTGRLPTTQANLDLINARIKKVQSDMTILDNQVSAGQIDNRVAAYKRQQLIGEVDELRRVIANSRLSTPSYKTPSDIRTGKPAKKYISYSDSRAFISDYGGPAPINKASPLELASNRTYRIRRSRPNRTNRSKSHVAFSLARKPLPNDYCKQ